MKISFVILSALMCLLHKPLTEGKTIASGYKNVYKTISDIHKKGFQYTNIPEILVNAAPILQNLHDLWHVLLRQPDLSVMDALFRSKEHEIIGRIITISDQISKLDSKVNSIAETTVRSVLETLPKMINLERNLHDLQLIINQINFSHEQLRSYLIFGYKNVTSEENEEDEKKYSEMTSVTTSKLSQNGLKFGSLVGEMSNDVMKRDSDPNWLLEKFTLLDFAAWATGHGFNSLKSLVRRLNDMVLPEFTGVGIFDLVKNFLEETQNGICNVKQSPQQTLYNLYNTLSVAELKAQTVLQFSYMLLKMYNKGNFTVEADLARSTYEQSWKETIDVARKTMSNAGRSYYKCDPNQYVEGVTHTKLTKLLQGYIENEVNLNPYGTCRENCQYYQYTEYNGCFKSKFCAHQPPCRGKVTECRFVDSDMNICTSTNPERRYDWIEYENGKILGSKGVCQVKNFFKVDSWWRYLFWHCSYCLCLCDDAGPDSDRFFNLRDVTSDIEKNMIVTGVKIVKNNQIIHFQIQQGVLSPFGVINKTSLSWKPVDNYTIDDDDVQNDVDYFTMTWLKRAIDTDEVSGPSEHVVTGLRFRKIGSHLNLEVRVTPINFTTGEVFKADHSYWIGNDNTNANPKNPRTEVLLTNPDIPIRNGPHHLNSKHDQYVQFQSTSFDTDAGQTVVPFFDSQDLTAQGYPLSGIGLIHRGKQNSGGFIAPKLISYDFTPHLLFEKSTLNP